MTGQIKRGLLCESSHQKQPSMSNAIKRELLSELKSNVVFNVTGHIKMGPIYRGLKVAFYYPTILSHFQCFIINRFVGKHFSKHTPLHWGGFILLQKGMWISPIFIWNYLNCIYLP